MVNIRFVQNPQVLNLNFTDFLLNKNIMKHQIQQFVYWDKFHELNLQEGLFFFKTPAFLPCSCFVSATVGLKPVALRSRAAADCRPVFEFKVLLFTVLVSVNLEALLVSL